MGDPSLSASPRARTQADRLFQHCVYRIATGRWLAGDRLPSIRQTRRSWGLNQQTVEEAYRRLADLGLVESRPRSGYYVAGGGALGRLVRHRRDLASLHREVAEQIRTGSDLSPLGVLRYLAELEEIERARQPEVAFVECTATQAHGHAEEIAARLRVPVLASTTREIAGRPERVPAGVRRLLTSAFHIEELRPLHRPPELTVRVVPIELSAEAVAEVGGRDVLLLEREETMASHIARDAARLLGEDRVHTRLTEDPAGELQRILGVRRTAGGPVVLLSPRLWGALPASLRKDPRVREAAFGVSAGSWGQVAEAVGLPFPVP